MSETSLGQDLRYVGSHLRRHPIGTLLTTLVVGGSTVAAGIVGHNTNRHSSSLASLRAHETAQAKQDVRCINDQNNMRIPPTGKISIKLGALSTGAKADCRVEWLPQSSVTEPDASPPLPGVDHAASEVTLPSQTALEDDAITQFKEGQESSVNTGYEVAGELGFGIIAFTLSSLAAAAAWWRAEGKQGGDPPPPNHVAASL